MNCNYIATSTILFKHSSDKSVANNTTEIHTHNEIILPLRGDVSIYHDGLIIPVPLGAIIIIPKLTEHKIIVDPAKQYERIVINFDDNDIPDILCVNPISKLSLIENPSDEIIGFLNYISNINKTLLSSEEVDCTLKSVLSLILIELSKIGRDNVRTFDSSKMDSIAKAIEFINLHFAKKINLEDMAEHVGISKSRLTKKFKDNIGMSVHKYIVRKRLLYANELIKSGVSPTDACYNCGYTDYSAFYRAYVSYFQKAPSDSKKFN